MTVQDLVDELRRLPPQAHVDLHCEPGLRIAIARATYADGVVVLVLDEDDVVPAPDPPTWLPIVIYGSARS